MIARALAQGGELLPAHPDEGDGVGHDGAADESAQPGLLALQPSDGGPTQPVAASVDEGELALSLLTYFGSPAR